MNPRALHSFLEYPSEIRGTNNIFLKSDLGVLDILQKHRPRGIFLKSKADQSRSLFMDISAASSQLMI